VLKVVETVWSVDREPLADMYAALHMLKVVEVVWSVDRESFTFYTRRCTCKKYKMVRDINR
jgi:hypothetical protein